MRLATVCRRGSPRTLSHGRVRCCCSPPFIYGRLAMSSGPRCLCSWSTLATFSTALCGVGGTGATKTIRRCRLQTSSWTGSLLRPPSRCASPRSGASGSTPRWTKRS
eukprot:Amastigsp_a1609_259.p5 type:complete len:107 gc:universal Amastigsp_a1609_259:152-472(+)